MLLRHSLDFGEAADAIEGAVADALEAGIRTVDIALDKRRAVGTTDMGDAVAERILSS